MIFRLLLAFHTNKAYYVIGGKKLGNNKYWRFRVLRGASERLADLITTLPPLRMRGSKRLLIGAGLWDAWWSCLSRAQFVVTCFPWHFSDRIAPSKDWRSFDAVYRLYEQNRIYHIFKWMKGWTQHEDDLNSRKLFFFLFFSLYKRSLFIPRHLFPLPFIPSPFIHVVIYSRYLFLAI